MRTKFGFVVGFVSLGAAVSAGLLHAVAHTIAATRLMISNVLILIFSTVTVNNLP